MADASWTHGGIVSNLVGLLHPQLANTECSGRVAQTKVRSGPPDPRPARDVEGLFTYPDVVVVCGKPQLYDDHGDVLLNPKAVFGVLSPSTEAFDRGEKFRRYRRWNATLTDYVLISQDEPLVEVHTRLPNGEWAERWVEELTGVVELPNINCTLRLADLYACVDFPPEPAPDEAP